MAGPSQPTAGSDPALGIGSASENEPAPRLILASSSPRRLQILQQHGLDPQVVAPDIDESLPSFEGIRGLASALQELALRKARAVLAKLSEPGDERPGHETDKPGYGQTTILAADTVVYLDEVLGKPRDSAEAFAMLTKLSGRTHYVLSAVALIDDSETSYCVFAEVTFTDYGPDAIKKYIADEAPFDKAGSYAIQGSWWQHVQFLMGEIETVIGLPWQRLAKELRQRGFTVAPAPR